MFTVAELQKRYSVSQGTVLGWITSGELKAVNVGRKANTKKPRWRISQAALDAFEATRTPSTTEVERPKRIKVKRPDVIQFYS